MADVLEDGSLGYGALTSLGSCRQIVRIRSDLDVNQAGEETDAGGLGNA